jgi:hypothetical protein
MPLDDLKANYPPTSQITTKSFANLCGEGQRGCLLMVSSYIILFVA